MAHLAMRREYRETAPNDPEDLKTPRNVIPTTGLPEASRAERMQASEVGVHPAAVEIAVAAAIWFLPVTWLAFASRDRLSARHRDAVLRDLSSRSSC